MSPIFEKQENVPYFPLTVPGSSHWFAAPLAVAVFAFRPSCFTQPLLIRARLKGLPRTLGRVSCVFLLTGPRRTSSDRRCLMTRTCRPRPPSR